MMDRKVVEQREHKVMEAVPLKHLIHSAWTWRIRGSYFLQKNTCIMIQIDNAL